MHLSLKPFRSLRAVIPLALFVITCVVALTNYVYELRIQAAEMNRAMHDEVNNRLYRLQTILDYFQEDNAGQQIQQILATYSSDEYVTGAWFIDDRGIVLAAMRRADIGQAASDVMRNGGGSALAELYDVASRQIRDRSAQYTVVEHGDRIAGVSIVTLAARSGELRPTRYGILFLAHSLRAGLERARETARIRTTTFIAFTALISILLGLALHVLLMRRLTEFVGVASQFAGGDLKARMRPGGHDELGVLATAFNDMAARVGTVQKDLARLNAELEQRVRERTNQLESANSELDSFCYSVSHDLRAPLRAIDGFGMALSEDCAAQLDDSGRGYLERIRSATRYMGQLIDDMLALSRLARAEVRFQPINLSEMAREIVRGLEHGAPQRFVRVSVEPNLQTRGDPVLLRAMLENLLGNAWKFTAKTAEARIEFGKTVKNGEDVFYVRDNGAGFDMRYMNKLFSPFQRLHSREEFEGTGVGLASVRRIALRHGGHIWAEGAVGAGASFYFTLHAAAVQLPPRISGVA